MLPETSIKTNKQQVLKYRACVQMCMQKVQLWGKHQSVRSETNKWASTDKIPESFEEYVEDLPFLFLFFFFFSLSNVGYGKKNRAWAEESLNLFWKCHFLHCATLSSLHNWHFAQKTWDIDIYYQLIGKILLSFISSS